MGSAANDAFAVDGLSAEIRCFDDSAQGFAHVGGDGAAVVQLVRGDGEFRVGVEDGEVGFAAFGE